MPVSERVSQPLLRWVADYRGRLVALESGNFLNRFAADPIGLGWRMLLADEDRRLMLAAAAANARPQPR